MGEKKVFRPSKPFSIHRRVRFRDLEIFSLKIGQNFGDFVPKSAIYTPKPIVTRLFHE
jgi:hypothetical protein